MSKRVKRILMERDGISSDQADDLIKNFQLDFDHALDAGDVDWAEELLAVHFGLEPDYIEDFLI